MRPFGRCQGIKQPRCELSGVPEQPSKPPGSAASEAMRATVCPPPRSGPCPSGQGARRRGQSLSAHGCNTVPPRCRTRAACCARTRCASQGKMRTACACGRRAGGGRNAPPRPPAPASRPSTVRGHARRATTTPPRSGPGASAPGARRRAAGLARMAERLVPRASLGLAFGRRRGPLSGAPRVARPRPRHRPHHPTGKAVPQRPSLAARGVVLRRPGGARSPKHRGAAPAPPGLPALDPARDLSLDPTEPRDRARGSDRCASPPQWAAGLSKPGKH